jgi:hypothetical protein
MIKATFYYLLYPFKALFCEKITKTNVTNFQKNVTRVGAMFKK